MFAFNICFFFLYCSNKDEKDAQDLILEKTKEVESLRNSSLVIGARVSVSHIPGRLIEWKKGKLKMMKIKLLNNVNLSRSQPEKCIFIRDEPCFFGRGGSYHSYKQKNETVHMNL